MMQKKQILVVEDNEINRAILCEILSCDYRVLEAENGQEALNILRQHKDSVALILLDVMMPVMDGYTFLDRVKEDNELSLIPVIVTTQSGSESDEVAALAHGATDFVPKPYRPQVILHRVASLIKLRETAAMVNQFQFDRLTGLYSKEFFFRKVRERLQEDPRYRKNPFHNAERPAHAAAKRDEAERRVASRDQEVDRRVVEDLKHALRLPVRDRVVEGRRGVEDDHRGAEDRDRRHVDCGPAP